MADQQFFSDYSDLHKDVYGFRPRNNRFLDATPEEQEKMWDYLLEENDRVMKEDEEREIRSDKEFENGIKMVMEIGAPDRETAIRWILSNELDEYDLRYGFDYIRYNWGISYKYQKEIQPILDSLLMQYEEAV